MKMLTLSILGLLIASSSFADSAVLNGTYVARKRTSFGNTPDCKVTGAHPFRFISGPLNNSADSDITVVSSSDQHTVINYMEEASSRVWIDTNRLLPSTNTEDSISYLWRDDSLTATYKTVSYPDMHKEVIILSYTFSLDANGNLKVSGDVIEKSGIFGRTHDHSHVECVYQRKSN